MKPTTPLPPLNAKRWDLLQKLLRLALDNNQEHEAAAAAIQVCRLLRELQIVERLERLPSPPTVPPPPADPYERFARRNKWWGNPAATQSTPQWDPKAVDDILNYLNNLDGKAKSK